VEAIFQSAEVAAGRGIRQTKHFRCAVHAPAFGDLEEELKLGEAIYFPQNENLISC
jgi:hypothetical protein